MFVDEMEIAEEYYKKQKEEKEKKEKNTASHTVKLIKSRKKTFPNSLLSTREKYSIPGTPFSKTPAAVLNEFLINVDENKSFEVKFRNIFKSTTITFTSASQCRRWLGGSNFNYWPQQLNFAVWCATSGCGISLSENYPPMIQRFLQFHTYFTIRRILYELEIPLPDDAIFKQTNNRFNKIAFNRLCQEFNLERI